MNIWDILILGGIAGAVFLALRGRFGRKKRGRGGSCACCSGCPERLSKDCAAGKGGGRN